MDQLTNRQKFLRELRRYLVDKFDSQQRAAIQLNMTSSMLSLILHGKRTINLDLKEKLIKSGFSPKYFMLLDNEMREKQQRKDEFLLILEQKDDVILNYKYLYERARERIDQLLKDRESLLKEVNYYRRKLDIDFTEKKKERLKKVPL